MKILYVTTIGVTMDFFKSFIKQLLDEGNTIDIATNENTTKVPAWYKEQGCVVYQIDLSRSPLTKGNLTAIKQLKEIVDKGKYDLVHCHTPVASMCTRLACRRARKNGTRVFYTAHGFHFYKGAPLKNWLLYYPVEKICARFTDVLITINKEDYSLAKKKMKAKRVEYVPGVGVDLYKFSHTTVDKTEKRKELGIPADATLLLSVGELNKNKNHETVIRAIANLEVYYIIAGDGDLKGHLQSTIDELDMTERVKLLGFRTDIAELCSIADVFIFPSFREGLGLAAIEAMASGLPLITSNIHGINDYSIDGVTGYKCPPDDIDGFSQAIKHLSNDASLRKHIGNHNKIVADKYSLESINVIMKTIYGM